MISLIRRRTFLPRKLALRSCTYGFGLGPQSRKLHRPVACLTVRTMASLSLFFGTIQQHLNLPNVALPTISLWTINRVSVSRAFLCMRVFCNNFCSLRVSVHLCSLVYSLLFQLYDFVPSTHSSV